MKQLSYAVLEEQGYNGYLLREAPERVLQFGEGNFLRAFVDYFFDVLNEKADFNGKVVLCQPKGSDLVDEINRQEGLYTLYLQGFAGGQRVRERRVISCVSRCLHPRRDYAALMKCAQNPDLRYIVCNTTEAGIVYDPSCEFLDQPASSYPGKLTQFLYERFLRFGHEPGRGFVVLACELIEDNGRELESCVLQYARQWALGEDFVGWLRRENLFCSTLVDRIVTGYPKGQAATFHKENGYEDRLLDTGEVFGFWVIEGPESLKEELPFEKAGLPVLITCDHKPYKQRKVRILNGAHTTMALGAYLAGQNIVRGCMEDKVIRDFMKKTIYEEIIPTLDLPREELAGFAASVMERFQNPFLDHSLLAIGLNSTSKWKARVLPSLKGYVERFQQLPGCITASFAFYIAFCSGQDMTAKGLLGKRGEEEYLIQDDRQVLEFFEAYQKEEAEEVAHAVCIEQKFWGEDLSEIPGFEKAVSQYLTEIRCRGAYEVMRGCLQERGESGAQAEGVIISK
ncbi:MAG: tagaturonate reductase [Lachnospiraceae bacterium]|nr:tagaturonate reductase [Lachnospiraceae bacterium]